jgi:hypothetical protein
VGCEGLGEGEILISTRIIWDFEAWELDVIGFMGNRKC